jgi:Protein of unknown function (DUF2924)
MRKRSSASRALSIEDQVAHLRDLDLNGLRSHWQNEFSRTAPKHLSRYLLFRVLAYRIQADQFGDLDIDTLKVLERAHNQKEGTVGVTKGLATLDQRRFPSVGMTREAKDPCLATFGAEQVQLGTCNHLKLLFEARA